MALQLSMRRGLSTATTASLRTSASSLTSRTPLSPLHYASQSSSILGKAAATRFIGQRWLSTADAGDVIGIDLGTTNSCVAIMVRGCRSWL